MRVLRLCVYEWPPSPADAANSTVGPAIFVSESRKKARSRQTATFDYLTLRNRPASIYRHNLLLRVTDTLGLVFISF